MGGVGPGPYVKKSGTAHFAPDAAADSMELIRSALGTVPIFSLRRLSGMSATETQPVLGWTSGERYFFFFLPAVARAAWKCHAM